MVRDAKTDLAKLRQSGEKALRRGSDEVIG
jgi:hypothetical protein